MTSLEYLDRSGVSKVISYFKNRLHILLTTLEDKINTILVEGMPTIKDYLIEVLFLKPNELSSYGNVEINHDKIITL